MSLHLASVIVVATFAAAAPGQFPLGPGNAGSQAVVDPAINEYVCRSVVEHAMSSTLNPIRNAQVELVSARWQGELVFVFSRVHWTTKSVFHRTGTANVAEVQYSMVQRRFRRCIFDLWCCATKPTIYQYYDLGRVRTKINNELYRFDLISGDNLFPGPWPRGPSTIVPQVSTSSATPSSSAAGRSAKLLDEPVAPPVAIPPTPGSTPAPSSSKEIPRRFAPPPAAK